MQHASYFQLTYCVATTALISTVAMNQRGYQDAWILQDVLVPTVVYVFVFVMTAISTRSARLLSFICSSFIITMNAIPNLKYTLFYGTYDSAAHYGFVDDLLHLGHIPESGFYAGYYASHPGMHLFIASLSLVLGISAVAAIKLLTSTIFGIIPFMTYFVTKDFEGNMRRNIIIASALPVVSGYVLLGATFGVALYFAFICVLIGGIFWRRKIWPYSLILFVFGYALLFSHAVTMFVLLLTLGVLIFLSALRPIQYVGNYMRNIASILMILMVSFLFLEMVRSSAVFESIAAIVQEMLLGVPMTGIPIRFGGFPLFARLRLLLVNDGADAVILMLSLLGLAILLKRRTEHKQMLDRIGLPLTFIEIGIGALLLVQLAYGALEYHRSITYGIMFQAFFSGLVLWRVGKSGFKHRLILTILIMFLSISVCLIQFFPYQPMVPAANVLSKDLPEDEYLYDMRMVNSEYQLACIHFAERHSPSYANIASDSVTKWQIYGFASESFASRHTYFSPLDTDMTGRWDILLLHYDGFAGPLSEKAEYRTSERIRMLQDGLGNVVYHNGGSFIIEQ